MTALSVTAPSATLPTEPTVLAEWPGEAQRRPGRPRDTALQERAIQAVIDLIDAGRAVTAGEVVERSGVSRAALYRRWETLNELIAAALDVGRVVVQPPEHLATRAALRYGFPTPEQLQSAPLPEGRIRQRLLLALTDPDLQHKYWEAHVSRRRKPLLAILQRAQNAGEVRADVDLEATLDLLSGVYYYQIVARGADLGDPATLKRCGAAMDIIWDGIVTEEGLA